MERQDAKKILEVLRIAYPNHYRNIAPRDAQAMLELYYSRFKDYPVQIVAEALNAYIDENEYPPTIAGIKKYLVRFSGEKDYDALFTELWKGICGNLKFEQLSTPNQKYIGNQQVLNDMGADERTVMEVVKGQYMRRIPEIVENEKFEKRVETKLGAGASEELKTRLQGITTKMLEGRNEQVPRKENRG